MSFALRVLVLIIPISFIGLFFVLLSTENEYPGADYKIYEIPDFSLSNLNGTNLISNKNLDVVYKKSVDKDYLSDNPMRRCPNIDKAKNLLNYNQKLG